MHRVWIINVVDINTGFGIYCKINNNNKNLTLEIWFQILFQNLQNCIITMLKAFHKQHQEFEENFIFQFEKKKKVKNQNCHYRIYSLKEL